MCPIVQNTPHTMNLLSFISDALLMAAKVYETTNGENAITYPVGGTLDGAYPQNITWLASTNGTVTLRLLKGPPNDLKNAGTLARGIRNNGSFVWNIPASLEDSRKMPESHKYGLKIFDDNTRRYEYSPPFDIWVPNSTFKADRGSVFVSLGPES